MGFLGTRKPNVKALARREDVEGLVQAATFSDPVPSSDGGMSDRGAVVREAAILALGGLAPAAGNGTVAAALRDPSDRVRTAAVRVLHAREEAQLLAQALSWLPAQPGNARRLAIHAIAELDGPGCARAVTRAIACAEGEDPPRDEEVELLTRLVGSSKSSEATSEVIDELLSALADEREALADRAEELLAGLSPACLEGLIAELKTGGGAAHRAASVLGRIKDTRALGPLMNGLDHSDARVRAESAAALGELRDPAAVEALMRATRDSHHAVRAQAGWALDRIGAVAFIVGVSHLVRPVIQEAIVSGSKEHPALPDGRQRRTLEAPEASPNGAERSARDEAEALRREAAEAARQAAAEAAKEAAELLRRDAAAAARRETEALRQEAADARRREAEALRQEAAERRAAETAEREAAQVAERAAVEAAQQEAAEASASALEVIRAAERQLDEVRKHAARETDALREAIVEASARSEPLVNSQHGDSSSLPSDSDAESDAEAVPDEPWAAGSESDAARVDSGQVEGGDAESDWVGGDLRLAIVRAQMPGSPEFRILGSARSAADVRKRFAWKTDEELATSFAIAAEAQARAQKDGSEADATYWELLVQAAVKEAATRPAFGELTDLGGRGRRERRLLAKRLAALADARQAGLETDEIGR
jgi:HEAT repeat protein